MKYAILFSILLLASCSPHGNQRNDLLLSMDDLPEISPKFSCDDLYAWRQEVYMVFEKKLEAQEKQLKKHQ